MNRSIAVRQRVNGANALSFVRRDGGILLEHVAQFVDAFEQTVLGEGVDGKFDVAFPRPSVSVCAARSIFDCVPGRIAATRL